MEVGSGVLYPFVHLPATRRRIGGDPPRSLETTGNEKEFPRNGRRAAVLCPPRSNSAYAPVVHGGVLMLPVDDHV